MEFGQKRGKIRRNAAAKNTRARVYHVRINHAAPLARLHRRLTRLGLRQRQLLEAGVISLVARG